jgi:(p)ppGpp synthase/HD superfamily hydrolase
MITIEEALRIAIDAHEGQTDLDGKPVILHPLTVGLAGKNREEMIGGFLHDVVEDSDITFDDLLAKGVDKEIVDALRLLTHDKGTDYYEYVQRIIDSGNPIALAIKRNDLTHNLARGRANGHWKQVNKHEKAMEMISHAV